MVEQCCTKFIQENKHHDPCFWSRNVGSSLYSNWCGLAFERVCLTHIPQIKKALGIGGVTSNEYSWFARKTEERSAIPLWEAVAVYL